MLKTNINIQYGRQQLHYGVEYIDNSWSTDKSFIKYCEIPNDESDVFQFVTSIGSSCIRNINTWSAIDYESDTLISDFIPEKIDISSFNIYFPQHSVETYSNNNFYIIEFNTYVNGDKLILGCFLLDRRDAIAFPGKKIIAGERYYEYINIKVPDPWNIIYSDEWAEFRQNVCQEPANINNTGSLIGIEIHPVYIDNNIWYKNLDFVGGFNSLLISDLTSDYLAPVLSIEKDDNNTPKLTVSFRYNTVYDSLEEYIRETYQIAGEIDARTSIMLHDEENVYNYYMFTGTPDHITIEVVDPDQNIPFTDWTGVDEEGNIIEYWKDGLMFTAFFSIYIEDEPAISIKSNNLPLTKDLYSILLQRKDGVPSEIDLNEIEDLNIIINDKTMTDINIVNKIEKNIVNIQRPSDYKSGIARPVFVKVYDNSDNIQVHPTVTENIGINLQKYKNMVKLFTLKIADTEFPEIGRIGVNVVFKVLAGSLPEDLVGGQYYILDDNKEVITFGNYNI